MQRNLLVLQGALRDIRGVPAAVRPLFREQFDGPLFHARCEHEVLTATSPVTIRTVCYSEADRYTLPQGAVKPRQGAEVSRALVQGLPTLTQAQVVDFPTYAQELLHSEFVQACLLEAAKIMSRLLGPTYHGAAATRAALTDIYLGAVDVEGRYPGLLHARLARPKKQFLHWLVWLGRNANAGERRYYRHAQATLSLEEHLVAGDEAWGEPEATDVAALYDERLQRTEHQQWAAAQVQALQTLPADVVAVLQVVGEVGNTYQAARRLGIAEAQVYAALREARVLLQARELCHLHDLADLPPEMRERLLLTAERGLGGTAAHLQCSTRAVMQSLRDAQVLWEARDLLRQLAGVCLAEEMTNILSLVAEQGQRQAAATLGVTLTMLREVLNDARARAEAGREPRRTSYD